MPANVNKPTRMGRVTLYPPVSVANPTEEERSWHVVDLDSAPLPPPIACLTAADLAEQVATQSGLDQAKTREVVQRTLDAIAATLAQQGRLVVSDGAKSLFTIEPPPSSL